MRLTTEKGERVVFSGENGHDQEQLDAQVKLTIGEMYTVKKLTVGNWYSEVEFEEAEGRYNSVMFENWDN